MNYERRLISKGLLIGLACVFVPTLVPVAAKAAEITTPPNIILPGGKELEQKTIVCPIEYLHSVPSEDVFERHLSSLLEKDYFPVAIRDVASSFYNNTPLCPKNKKPVAISFDDSLEDQENAFKVLRRYQATATFFVLTDYADGVHKYLDLSRIREIFDAGYEIGAHGRDMHKSLPVLRVIDPEAWKRNILGVKERLDELLGEPVVSFAYPNGDYDPETVAKVIEAGYKIAVRTGGNYPNLTTSTLFTLPRIAINF